MSLLLKSNLDKSLSTVPASQERNYFLNADGSLASTLKTWIIYLIHKIPYVQSYYDPIVTNIVEVFAECVKDWEALKNTQKYLIAVDTQDFDQQIKRICFVAQFILAYQDRIEAHNSTKEQISNLLTHLLPDRTISLPQTLQELTPEVLYPQLDLETKWKMEEKSPLPLSPAILQIPAPHIEVLDPLKANPHITELPTFYKSFMQRMENPTGRWLPLIKDWWKGPHLPAQQSLQAMCKTILEDDTPVQQLTYGSAKLYLGKLLSLFKSGIIPDEKIKNCLAELVYASSQCAGDWATVAERQYHAFTGKEATPRDKSLQWKSAFIDQHLKLFFPTVYTKTEDEHNVHLMNTLLYHYGDRLGMKHLYAPSADRHVVKKATSLPYQWPDVFRYLTEVWKNYSIESLKTYSQLNKWDGSIGQFLTAFVKEKISSDKDPQEYVMTEYFDEKGLLNNRGAARFLRETLQ